MPKIQRKLGIRLTAIIALVGVAGRLRVTRGQFVDRTGACNRAAL